MTPRPLTVALVDAFTRTAGCGNRAGVVLDADALDDAAMQRIAAVLGLSETAFVTRPASGDTADFRLRWFTPTNEVEFCGHGTVATLHRMAEVGRLTPGQVSRFACRAGECAVSVEPDPTARWQVWTDIPAPRWTAMPIEPELVGELLGADASAFDTDIPARCTHGVVFVPIVDRATLLGLRPQYAAMALEQARGLEGVCAFTRDVLDAGDAAFSRFFVPAHGIPEDPVTGSTNGPLAALLAESGALDWPAGCDTHTTRCEQGEALGRPGRVDVELRGSPDGVTHIRIGSEAVTVLVGAMA